MIPRAETLLVVDDNEMNRDMLSRRLERHGYAVAVAADGREALELLARQEISLLLLDIEMPGLSGLEVLQAIRSTRTASELPVIMVTARQHSQSVVEALGLGANDYVTKPVDFAVALARIETQLARRRAEAALRESEERYALAVRGANDGLWDWNLRTNEVYYSPRWKAMLGLADGDVTGSPDEWFTRVHPEEVDGVTAAISAHVNGLTPHFEVEHRMQHRDGAFRWIRSRGLAVRDADGKAYRMAGSQTDVTEGKVADALTGLPNRILFNDRLAHSIERTKRYGGYVCAVIILDLDRFKLVNESLGHGAGDQLLLLIARRLEGCLRSNDMVARLGTDFTLARLGGDEFTVLLDDVKHVSDALRVAERIQEHLARPYDLGGQEVFSSVSIGIATTVGYDSPQAVLRDADTAMYRAKALGGARIELFDGEMRRQAVDRLRLETDLRRAIDRQEFRVHYQPIVALDSGAITGFEALVRWQHPERGLVSPGEFVPVAEETGAIVPIGTWVLREACRQTRAWQAGAGGGDPVTISVNLSGKQFLQPDLVDEVTRTLRDTMLPAAALKLEITESTLMAQSEAVIGKLHELKALGVQLAIDDFGTGYSSLSYVHRFPIDTLKIDRSFVARLGADGEGGEIVRAMTDLAHTLKLTVVAEGVENDRQRDELRALGCEYGQGYLFAKPMDEAAAGALLAKARATHARSGPFAQPPVDPRHQAGV